MRRSIVAAVTVLLGVSLGETASAATSDGAPSKCNGDTGSARVELLRPQPVRPSVSIGPNTALWFLPAPHAASTRLELDAGVERCEVGFPLVQGLVTKSGWLFTPQATSRGMSLMALSLRAGLVF